MDKRTKAEAKAKAGYREKYAMKHGKEERKEINGHILYVFRYPATDEYQDANGATYDATSKAWIN